ncbi:M50 family metallopeptidase [Microvirga sp. 3-52]|nr:M50 family metallopeptidase [Microvirga sp. 3-52]MBS7455339.1 M50 family metallopeptidase [Microvirga sp. 3-52]
MSGDPHARRLTAFHETGHAVLGWALGYKVERMRITSDLSAAAI